MKGLKAGDYQNISIRVRVCPNCGGALRVGESQLLCFDCGAVFTIEDIGQADPELLCRFEGVAEWMKKRSESLDTVLDAVEGLNQQNV